MLESLLNPQAAERRPYEMFFMALAFGTVATALATVVGSGGEVGHLVVAFCCIAAAPMLVRLFQLEEEKDESSTPGSFWGRHKDVLILFGWYFLGIIVATSLLFTILPGNYGERIFSAQVDELNVIQSMSSGRVVSGCDFLCLFENNLGVLALALIFSFVFGAGAVYIITWNASIVGVLIGMIARDSAAASGGSVMIAYLIALPMSLISLFPHGIFEVGAYFFAGLGGGILSVAVVRGQWRNRQVLKDVAKIFIVGVVLVFIGAIVEAFV